MFVTGCIGLLGTKPSYDMMMGCDTLLMIDSTYPYRSLMIQRRGNETIWWASV